MKLWLLRPHEEQTSDNPWQPWYDKTFGFVIRAESEAEARQIAGDNSCAEGDAAWTEPRYSTCTELTPDGPVGVIIEDEHRA